MGAYFHVAPRIKTCVGEEGRPIPGQLAYAGRPACASTATGFGKVGPPSPEPPLTAFRWHRCANDARLQRDLGTDHGPHGILYHHPRALLHARKDWLSHMANGRGRRWGRRDLSLCF